MGGRPEQAGPEGRRMSDQTLTVRDNRTGATYELPIVDGAVRAQDLRQIKAGPDDFGLRVFMPSRPPAVRLVCGSWPSGRSFACGFLPTTRRRAAVAVRLGVPVIKVPRGLTPPSHFPNRFRYRLTAPVTALRAMPGAHKKRRHPGGMPPCDLVAELLVTSADRIGPVRVRRRHHRRTRRSAPASDGPR